MSGDPFVGELVRLRGRREEDRELIAAMEDDLEVTSWARVDAVAPMAVEDLEAVWDHLRTEPGERYVFIIETREDGRAIGRCGLKGIDPRSRRAEVSVLLLRDAWGQGHGTEALGILLRFAFDELALHKVSLRVDAGNERAIGAYRRVGLHLDATLRDATYRDGAHRDVAVMSILAPEWRDGRS